MPKFDTVRFGELVYRDQDIVTLPDGLVGMPEQRNWLILDMGEGETMKWFQSLDRGDFGFPVTQPYFFLEDYEFDLSRTIREQIGNKEEEALAVLIITTVHPGGAQVTGNMLAPLVIDTQSRRGAQLTLDGDFSLKQEINYFKFGLAVNAGASEDASQEPVGEPKAEISAEARAEQGTPGRESADPVAV